MNLDAPSPTHMLHLDRLYSVTPYSRVRVHRKTPSHTLVALVRFVRTDGSPALALPFRLEQTVTMVNGVQIPPHASIEVDCAIPGAQIEVTLTQRSPIYGILRRIARALGVDRLRNKVSGIAFEQPHSPACAILPAEIPTPPPLVSFIIPTRDRADLLRKAVTSLFENSSWPNRELIVVDNGSSDVSATVYLDALARSPDVRVIRCDEPFNFAKLVNVGAAAAHGSILALLNNDVETSQSDWLTPLVRLVLREDAGVVGTKLLYPDNTVQHAGIALGIGGLAGHPGRSRHASDPGPMGMLSTTRKVSAVTGACLLVKREIFERLGGFDEEFVIEFNDVDFCLRAGQLGLAVICAASPALTHNEGATRSARSLRPQEIADRSRFVRKWGHALVADPHYPDSLSLEDESLSPASA